MNHSVTVTGWAGLLGNIVAPILSFAFLGLAVLAAFRERRRTRNLLLCLSLLSGGIGVAVRSLERGEPDPAAIAAFLVVAFLGYQILSGLIPGKRTKQKVEAERTTR